MFKFKRMVAASLCAAAMMTTGHVVQAQDWPAGDVKLIIPSSPGGGFDTYARILGKIMGENVGVQIVPENVSGGGGMRGAQATYRSRGDGKTFAVFNVPGIIQPIVNGDDVPYKVEEIEWIGSMAHNQYVVVVAKDSPFDTIEDLKAAGGTATFTGYGSSGLAANRILCGVVGLECQVITGYPGNNDALLGVVRGDAMASVTPITTAASFNSGGDLKALLLLSEREIAAFPDTQSASEAGYAELSNLGLVRAFGLPPKTDAETKSRFEAAFAEALVDPEMVAWSKDTNVPVDPLDGAGLKALIDEQTKLLIQYKDVGTGSN